MLAGQSLAEVLLAAEQRVAGRVAACERDRCCRLTQSATANTTRPDRWRPRSPVPIISARAWRIRVVKRESFHPLERVDEHSLPELLPLARDYCEFNGVNPSNDELLGVFRALTADPEHEGVPFLAPRPPRTPGGLRHPFLDVGYMGHRPHRDPGRSLRRHARPRNRDRRSAD